MFLGWMLTPLIVCESMFVCPCLTFFFHIIHNGNIFMQCWDDSVHFILCMKKVKNVFNYH